MTREEAIRIIKIVLVVAKNFEIEVQGIEFTEEKCKEAVDMAVEALKQEPCTDAISRQAVMDCFKKWQPYMATRLFDFEKELSALPPVTPEYTDAEIQKMQEMQQAEIQKAYELGKAPQPKMGQWIMHIDDLFPADSTMECNKCHEHQPITIDDNYCPNCGAKMEVEE